MPILNALGCSRLLSILLPVFAASCGLVQLHSASASGAEPARGAGSSTASPPTPSKARGTPTDPSFNQRAYNACVAEFDQHYGAWLVVDQAAKAVLLKARSESPYKSVPALVSAYLKVEAASSVRQSGEKPIGHVFALATKVELARELLRIGTGRNLYACLDPQFVYEPEDYAFFPPLVGDRERDKVDRCGSPDPALASARRDARHAMAEEAVKLSNAYRNRRPSAAMSGRVRGFETKPDHVVLIVDELADQYACVPNGRYGMVGGSWGPLCDYEDRPPSVVGKHTFRAAKEETPFKLQTGDNITFAYELDANAPASSTRVPKEKGQMWIAAVERKRKTVFDMCVRQEIWSLYHPVRSR